MSVSSRFALSDRKTQLTGLTAEIFTPFLSDESPRVVAQTLIALGRLGDASVAGLILPLAEQRGTGRPDPAEPNVAQVIPHLALRTLVELHAVDACLKALEDPQWQAALRALRCMTVNKRNPMMCVSTCTAESLGQRLNNMEISLTTMTV